MKKLTKYFLIILLSILLLGLIFIIISGIISPEPHFKITKENLTIKWLEENCEPILFEKNKPIKYKCGDFFVEVWEQIK